MSSTMRQIILFVAILALMTMGVSANNSRPPRNNDIANMADALKYLQDLETYYGDRARVRFGKRSPLMQLIRNSQNRESELNSPLDMSNVDEPF